MLGTALVCGLIAVAVYVAIGPDVRGVVTPAEGKHSHEAAVLAAAREYKSWPRVTDTVQVAPELCVFTPPEPLIFTSDSDDAFTHGRKLYYLFARDVDAYLSVGRASSEISLLSVVAAPKEQVIVKESWHPKAVAESAEGREDAVLLDNQWVVPGEQNALFMMLKVGDRDTEGTDQGWIYATTTPDGATVTGIGLIESCMGCHENAPYDRQFGLANKRVHVQQPGEE